MYRLFCKILFLCLLMNSSIQAQVDTSSGGMDDKNTSQVKGYHIGIVQIIFGVNRGDLTLIDKRDFYSIGFPMGVSLNTHGKVIIDFEVVPVIKPYINSSTPYSVHLLYHPGILCPLGNGWTFGFRLAFESGQGQFGFTPLLNKAFEIGNKTAFFVELVAPGRFGPEKNSGFTQLAGLHLGIGF